MIKQEARIMSNSFGFHGLQDFFDSAFRLNDISHVLPLAMITGVIERVVHTCFGLDSLEFIALIILFVLEIITGIWASLTKNKEYKELYEREKDKMSSLEKCELKEKIQNTKFSSSRFKRAGAVMGFWLIIIFIIWQFTKHDENSTVAAIFSTVHFVFLSYIIGIYLVSLIENVATISKSREKFTPLSIIKKILKLDDTQQNKK